MDHKKLGWLPIPFLLISLLFGGIVVEVSNTRNTPTSSVSPSKELLYSSSSTLSVNESQNPVQVGDQVTIAAKIVPPYEGDVQIEIDGANHSMVQIDQLIWRYNWTASSPGEFPYIVRFDEGEKSGTIEVLEKEPPQYSNLKILSNPLELGNNLNVSLLVTDSDTVNEVLLEYEGSNHTFANLGGGYYKNGEWTPSSLGNYTFTIYMKKNGYTWNVYSDLLEVVPDASPPTYKIPESHKESVVINESFSIKLEVFDATEVNQVLIEYDGANHSMINKPDTNVWYHDDWKPETPGDYPYTIYMEDVNGYWNMTTGTLTVLEATPDTASGGNTDFILPVIIIACIGAISGIIGVKKIRKKPAKQKGKLKTKKTIGKVNQLDSGKSKEEEDINKHPVSVVCPKCNRDFTVKIPKNIINEAKQLTTVSIPRNLGCEHHFQIFIDKNFTVRGYQKVDYEPSISPQHLGIGEENKTDTKTGRSPENEALLEVKEKLKTEAKHSDLISDEDNAISRNFENPDAIYYEIRKFLGIPDESFDLYKIVNHTYESDTAKLKVLEEIYVFTQKFSMFKDINPLMASLYSYVRQCINQKPEDMKKIDQSLIKTTLMGFISEFVEYTQEEQQDKVLDFLTESLGKLSLEPLVINLGLLLKPMYEDEEYLKESTATKMAEVAYSKDGDKETSIKAAINNWIEDHEITLSSQEKMESQLMKQFKKLARKHHIEKGSELYRTLKVDIKEMLALKFTVSSLMEGISDESTEPDPLK
ncbi:MAG: hypothetical protein R6U96_00305 [Promethearchaeia archaeon]